MHARKEIVKNFSKNKRPVGKEEISDESMRDSIMTTSILGTTRQFMPKLAEGEGGSLISVFTAG